MPSRRILQLGDPLLRTVSEPVSQPDEAMPIFEDLRSTLHEFRRTHGFGRGIVPYAIRNPGFEFQSEAKFRLWDDCFSFPGLLVHLERSQSVRVRYEDEEGKVRLIEAAGPLSELLQHEIDHLDGILAIDRALDRESFCTREEYVRRGWALG
jgi:peptide deformylase